VQHREHDFGGRTTARVLVCWNSPAVVDDRDRSVDVNRDVDLVAEYGQRLVDRVVYDFIDQVVSSGRSGRPDVHGRTLTDGLEALEDLDFVRTILLLQSVLFELYALVGICHFCVLRLPFAVAVNTNLTGERSTDNGERVCHTLIGIITYV
jgi:hypothetical protein